MGGAKLSKDLLASIILVNIRTYFVGLSKLLGIVISQLSRT